jgi:hypothetical protein
MQSLQLPDYLKNALTNEAPNEQVSEALTRMEDHRTMQSYRIFDFVPPDQAHLINNPSGQKPTSYLYLELSSQPVVLTINLGVLGSQQLRERNASREKKAIEGSSDGP